MRTAYAGPAGALALHAGAAIAVGGLAALLRYAELAGALHVWPAAGHGAARRAAAVRVVAVAGLVARRILSFVREGDVVEVGQRVGLIRFGSRVDVYLPAGTSPKVLLGQRSIAGETILAEIGSDVTLSGISQ